MGGRIFTHEGSRSRYDRKDDVIQSRPLELGAQWLHGTVGNPLFDFCVEEGIFDSQGVVLRAEGRVYRRDSIRSCYTCSSLGYESRRDP